MPTLNLVILKLASKYLSIKPLVFGVSFLYISLLSRCSIYTIVPYILHLFFLLQQFLFYLNIKTQKLRLLNLIPLISNYWKRIQRHITERSLEYSILIQRFIIRSRIYLLLIVLPEVMDSGLRRKQATIWSSEKCVHLPLIPVVAGLSFEFLKFSAKHTKNKIVWRHWLSKDTY